MNIIQGQPPKQIYLELKNFGQSSYIKNTRPNSILSFKKCKNIIDQIVNINCKTISMFFTAFTFEHKNALEIIAYAKNNNLSVNIFTQLEKLNELSICVLNSILNNEDNIYIEYKNINMQSFLKNIHFVMRENTRKNKSCNIYMKYNETLIDEIKKNFNKNIKENIIDKEFSINKFLKINETIRIVPDIKFICNKKCCYENLIILSNGNVIFCIDDINGKMKTGNVFKENLIHIWNNKNMVKYRKKIKGEIKCLNSLVQ